MTLAYLWVCNINAEFFVTILSWDLAWWANVLIALSSGLFVLFCLTAVLMCQGYTRQKLLAWSKNKPIPNSAVLLVGFVGLLAIFIATIHLCQIVKPLITSIGGASVYVGTALGLHAILEVWVIIACVFLLSDVQAMARGQHRANPPGNDPEQGTADQQRVASIKRTADTSTIYLILLAGQAASIASTLVTAVPIPSVVFTAISLLVCYELGLGDLLQEKIQLLRRCFRDAKELHDHAKQDEHDEDGHVDATEANAGRECTSDSDPVSNHLGSPAHWADPCMSISASSETESVQ